MIVVLPLYAACKPVLPASGWYGLKMFGPCGTPAPQGPEGDIPEVSQSYIFRLVSPMPSVTERATGLTVAQFMEGCR